MSHTHNSLAALFKDIADAIREKMGGVIELPTGYTQLQYISIYSGSGNGYIDTGYKATALGKVIVRGFHNTPNAAIIGSGTTQTSGDRFIICTASSGTDCKITSRIGSVIASGTSTFKDTLWHTIEVGLVSGNRYIKVDGTTEQTLSSTEALDSSNNLWIGGANYGGELKIPWGQGKIQILELYDTSGTMVAQFVPCKNSSNVVGMYDTVGRTFKTPSITSTGGPEILSKFKADDFPTVIRGLE